MSLYVFCFVSDIHFSIFYVCNWHSRFWIVGIIRRDEVSSVLAVGEPCAKKQRGRSHSYCCSSLLLIYSSLEYSCANISVCVVRLHSSLFTFCKLRLIIGRPFVKRRL